MRFDVMAMIAASAVGIGIITASNADMPFWGTLTLGCIASGTLSYCLSKRGE